MAATVREPLNNVYHGRWKVLRRVDSRFAVLDTEHGFAKAPVFADESDARAYAAKQKPDAIQPAESSGECECRMAWSGRFLCRSCIARITHPPA